MFEPENIRALLDLGVAGLLVIAIVGGYRGWYVWKWVYDSKAQESDEWKDIALRSLNVGERVVDRLAPAKPARDAAGDLAEGYSKRS